MTDLLQDDEYDRRFAGVAKIYGEDSFSHYEKSHVMVIGIGGVGSWAVEALARSGVGELTLVDMDVVAASNINRQLPAMSTTLGHEKIAVMAERCRAINPRIKINLIDDYLTPENIKEILAGAPEGFTVLSGDDPMTIELIKEGGKGVISVLGNAFPKEFSAIVKLALEGDIDKAQEAYQKIARCCELLFVDGNPGGVKCALHLMGYLENELRLPLVPVTGETEIALRQELNKCL